MFKDVKIVLMLRNEALCNFYDAILREEFRDAATDLDLTLILQERASYLFRKLTAAPLHYENQYIKEASPEIVTAYRDLRTTLIETLEEHSSKFPHVDLEVLEPNDIEFVNFENEAVVTYRLC